MLNSNHPDDERLSALASRDTDATADAALTGHVSTCDRCTDFVNELGALRASLAELPDLQPSRPLRLLPEVPAAVDRFGGWARRFFAPVLTAGAALAMVGLVGTAAPALNGMASSAGQAESVPSTLAVGEAAGGAEGEPAPAASAAMAAEAPSERTTSEGADALADGFADASASAAAEESADETDYRALASDESDTDREALTSLPADRSPWPMVLFTGVALMIGAALLRWILVPRAG